MARRNRATVYVLFDRYYEVKINGRVKHRSEKPYGRLSETRRAAKNLARRHGYKYVDATKAGVKK